MRLSDFFSRIDIAVYPAVALLLFLCVFIQISWRALRTPRTDLDRFAGLPNDESTRVSNRE